MTLLCWSMVLLVHLSKWLWAQTQLQWWTQLVQASGGALNPQKYCCALYYWRPDTSGILHLTTIDPENINIALCNIRLQQTIHGLKLDEGTQYLSLYMTQLRNTKPMQDHVGTKLYFTPKLFNRPICPAVKEASCTAPASSQHLPPCSQPWHSQSNSSSASTNYQHWQFWTRWDTTVIFHDSLCLHPMTWEALAFANSFTNKVPKKCWSHSDIYVQKPHSVRPWRHWFELTNCGPGSEATSSWTHNLAHRSPVSGCHPYISLCIPTVFRYAMPLGMFHLFKAAIASLWRILVTKTSLGINSKNSMLAGCFFKWLHCLKYWTTQVPNFYHKSWQLWLMTSQRT